MAPRGILTTTAVATSEKALMLSNWTSEIESSCGEMERREFSFILGYVS